MPPTLDTDGAVFERLRPRLKAISCRILGSEAEAEDIVQDCFLKWRDADQASLVTPAAWLTTVVQRQSIDRLRQRSRDVAALLCAAEALPPPDVMTPEELALRGAEIASAMASMMARLSAPERIAIVLHEVFEYEHTAIADLLGISCAGSRQHLARARKRLQLRAEELGPEEKLCRELVRDFQAAINGQDRDAVVTLLTGDQPHFVHEQTFARLCGAPSANDALFVQLKAA